MGKTISSLLDQDHTFADEEIKRFKLKAKQLLTFTALLDRSKLEKLNNTQIKDIFTDFLSEYEAIFPFITTPHAIERYFETKIREEIEDEVLVQKLLSPALLFDEERDSALKIAAHLKIRGRDAEYDKILTKHWQSFRWLTMWTLTASPLTKQQFDREIEELSKLFIDPELERRSIKKADEERMKAMMQIMASVKITPLVKQHVLLLQEYIRLRTYRKNVLCQAHFNILPLLKEISKRLSLTFNQINLLTFDEILDGLRKVKAQSELHKSAEKRLQGWGILMWKGKISCVEGIGNLVKKIEQYQIIPPSISVSQRIKGRTASLGKVIGKAKVIHQLGELGKVKRGDILVTRMTTPDFVVAMNRCAGIVTDEGGVTCHAAIVSRELGIPCLIATQTGTQKIHDNDLIELNASSGYVKVIEQVQLPENQDRLQGKSVHKGIVKGITKIIDDIAELNEIGSDAIIITSQVTPEYLSALYRCKGLVIEEDSLTSHAVLYANTLNIPTIMGLKHAKTLLNDGQKIKLDATKGSIEVIF